MNIVVSCSDKYLFCLKPFAYCFNKYWGSDVQVDVAGYTPPSFDLPSNFKFHSIASPGYPKEKWVDGFLKFLSRYEPEQFVLLLEDYWLCRNVDKEAVELLWNLMWDWNYTQGNRNLIRIDLTADRQYAGGMKNIGYCERLDLIQAAGSEYEMSLQAGLWNKVLLAELMYAMPSHLHSAWDVEMYGTELIIKRNLQVFGTRQVPVRYVNGMNNAAGMNIVNYEGFSNEDKDIVQKLVEEVKPK